MAILRYRGVPQDEIPYSQDEGDKIRCSFFNGLLCRWMTANKSYLRDETDGHYGSWEPPGWFLDYCKFLFSFVQSSYAVMKIQLLKNISFSRFWKKSKINNFTYHFAHKIHWASKKYFLKAYSNSWCYLLSFDRLHYIFSWKNKVFIFLTTVTDFERQLKNWKLYFFMKIYSATYQMKGNYIRNSNMLSKNIFHMLSEFCVQNET